MTARQQEGDEAAEKRVCAKCERLIYWDNGDATYHCSCRAGWKWKVFVSAAARSKLPATMQPEDETMLPATDVTQEERLEFAQKAVTAAIALYPEEAKGAAHEGLGGLCTYSGMVADYALRQLKTVLDRESATTARFDAKITALEAERDALKAERDAYKMSDASNREECSHWASMFAISNASFKNFHRSLCERFGYVHDEKDWQRDQVSLEEYIWGELKTSQVELAAMTEDRNLWRDDHNEDCPNLEEIEYIKSQLDAEKASKDTAYSERDRLVCALSKLFPAWLERHPDSDTAWENDWRWIVFVTLPTGQASWHIHDSEVVWFAHLERKDGNSWDGHSTAEKYARIERFKLIGELDAAVGQDTPQDAFKRGWLMGTSAAAEDIETEEDANIESIMASVRGNILCIQVPPYTPPLKAGQ